MRERIIECMKRIGVNVQENEQDFDINTYIRDSITFISFIIELENEFDVELPDEYILPNKLNKISNIVSVLEEIM